MVRKITAHPGLRPGEDADFAEVLAEGAAEGALAIERFQEIQEIVREDPQAIKFLEQVAGGAISYAEAVARHTRHVRSANTYGDGAKTRDRIQTADDRRRRAHDGLIADFQILNRYLGKHFGWKNADGEIPLGGIFSGMPEMISVPNIGTDEAARKALGNWAIALAFAFAKQGSA